MRGRPLPERIRRAVESNLGSVTGVHRVGGGCIDPAARIELADGGRAFIKWSEGAGAHRYGVEARGLRALSERGGISIPRVLGCSGDAEGPTGDREGSSNADGAWLLLEWIEPGPVTDRSTRRLGKELAHLHRSLPAGTPAGWDEDGWIATLPQPNGVEADWPGFWFRRRLLPQWERARRAHTLPPSAEGDLQALEAALPDILDGWQADGISLLHGDLWAGNVLTAADGTPYLVDPAVYRGHREVDLAMLDLFGSPGPLFREAYGEVHPLRPGHERRRAAYQLYPLLVHVNLFGGGYRAQALRCLRSILD